MLQKDRLNAKFEQEYKRLNEHQRKAVDKIEGPVMVIAGPGTGKTQILAARIGRILLDTDTDPSNILCLTYTDAGAIAMRKRLLEFIGPDAYKVGIYTFHGFCNEVIQDNLSLFEKNSLEPISDLERIELFKELIDTFPKNHPLKRYRGDVYYEIKNLQSLFSTMKKEGWTPAFIEQAIDQYMDELPTRSEYIYKKATGKNKAGDLNENKITEQRERMEKLRAAVHEFDRFQQMMRVRNRYDFDDMINWVIKAFNENPNLLANYQEQYQYILVDEYQDTSGTQNMLVKLLINFWGQQPNVFVVGDDDQSIYRFQGANVENMMQFAESYKEDLLKVVLTHNYRSIQPILDVSKFLIDRNQERLVNKITGLNKELISSHPDIKHLLHQPQINVYETQRSEMIDITRQVEKLITAGTSPGRIAVIYKENKYGEELTKYFGLRNIPVYSKRHLNVLEIPLAQKIINVLKYLAAEHYLPSSGDELLFEILHYNWFGIPPIEIAKLSIEVSQRGYRENKISLRQLLFEKAHAPAPDLFTPGIPDGMKKASIAIEKLMTDVSNVTLQNLFENIIREAGVLSNIMQSPDKHWQIQVLTVLFDFVKDETRRNPYLSLQQLVDIIELMEKEKLVLPLVQVTGTDKGVNLLTAHGSKGLEYEHVFFAGANALFWEKKRKPGGGYKLPDTIFSSSTSSDGTNESEELRRLFYVALTRAQQFLNISYCCFKDDGKEIEPSMFIAEMLDQSNLPVQKIYLNDEILTEFQSLAFAEEQSPEIEKMEEDFVNRILEKFVMNVTALNNYLKCPLEFYFKNLIRIPSSKNENTEFGSAVHHALNVLFEKMKNNNQVFPAKEILIEDFNWYMERHRESFTREQYNRRLEYGHEVLSNYYDQYIHQWNRVVAVETNISKIVLRGVPLKGKLDKLEFNGNMVNVVDYKTGDPDKSKAKLCGPSEKDPNGGDYWRQAVFYKILVDHHPLKNWEAVSAEFDFVEPDKKKKFRKEKIVISPADITTVTEQIVDTWQKIEKHDFYTGCGKEECHWCQFVKTNNMAVALHELQEQGMEDEV